MADKAEIYKRIKIIGALSFIPLVLGTGAVAGYFAGKFLEDTFHAPAFVLPILVTLGFIGSLFETVKILRFVIKAEDKGK